MAFALAVLFAAACAAQTSDATGANAAYARTVNQRTDKIVATLGISDPNKGARVRAIIAQQYRDLSQIHDVRDEQIRAAKTHAGTDKFIAAAAIRTIQDTTTPKLEKLHARFIEKLSAELSAGQVDQVKDGMTYGVVQVTHNAYLKMYPELTAAQKTQIMTWLVEARELAMDGSTSEEKHAMFGKFKGKINNYLSQAGYDAKQGEPNLKKASAPSSETKSE